MNAQAIFNVIVRIYLVVSLVATVAQEARIRRALRIALLLDKMLLETQGTITDDYLKSRAEAQELRNLVNTLSLKVHVMEKERERAR